MGSWTAAEIAAEMERASSFPDLTYEQIEALADEEQERADALQRQGDEGRAFWQHALRASELRHLAKERWEGRARHKPTAEEHRVHAEELRRYIRERRERLSKSMTVTIGQQFGSWEVLGLDAAGRRAGCRCCCGTVREVAVTALVDGTSRSCGCVPLSAEQGDVLRAEAAWRRWKRDLGSWRPGAE
jgi:hypothetical protein